MASGKVLAGSEDAYFELSFSPSISLVSVVRRFVSEFYAEVTDDAETTSRLAVATHELLENGARYSVDGHTSVRIGVTRAGSTTRISIVTRNRAEERDIRTLRKALDELEAADDPQAHYLLLMRRTAKMPEGSGLGLARIRAESEMLLRYEIEDATVVVRAEMRTLPREAS